MLRLPIVILAGALSAGALTLSASATTVSGSPVPIVNKPSASNLQLVAQRRVQRRVWVYNRRAHGPRFAYRHGRYRYYYGGWWYPRPWWAVAPGVGIAVVPGYGYAYPGYAYGTPGYVYGDPGYAGGGPEYGDEGDQGYADNGGGGDEGYGGGESDEHVQWCMNHYRTYDPQSDTYMSSNGRVRCPGPYLK